MTLKPALIGTRQILTNTLNSVTVILENKEILSYNKRFYTASLPRIEIGGLGQVSYRQLNYAVPPLQFEWQLILDDDKKSTLEGLTSIQQRNYSRNNERSNTDLVLQDERLAGLELNGFEREGTPIKNTGTDSKWKFSTYNIKIINFIKQRFDQNYWLVDITALESLYETIN